MDVLPGTVATRIASEERIVALMNRWLKSLYDYLVYQRTVEQKRKNKFILNDNVYDMFHAEIDKILPSVEYCLAPAAAEVSGRDPAELDRHAVVLHKLVDPTEVSRILMMLNFQGRGGSPYLAFVHQRVTQCFRQYGNMEDQDDPILCISEFQTAIKECLRVGDNGIEVAAAVTVADDSN